jgi:hypothetical protein
MEDPIQKITKVKRAGNVAHVTECLLSKHKALSSNPSTGEKKLYKKCNSTSVVSLVLSTMRLLYGESHYMVCFILSHQKRTW